MRGIVSHLVEMSDDIESSGIDHGMGLAEILFGHPSDIVVEKLLHLPFEIFETPVDVDIFAFLRRHEMYRANAVVERQCLEIV